MAQPFLILILEDGGPLKPGFGLSGDVRRKDGPGWRPGLSSCHGDRHVFTTAGRVISSHSACYHRPIRLFRSAQSLRAGSACL